MGSCKCKDCKAQDHLSKKGHDEVACHAQGERRNEIIKLINCWVETIEEDCGVEKKKNEPCKGSLLCYPEFSCLADVPKKPVCISSAPAPLITNIALAEDDRVTMTLANTAGKRPPPVWERPRVKSKQLIGGEFKDVAECFKRNGLHVGEFCPKTQSCKLMESLWEMIEEDRRIHGRDNVQLDCCCNPGDTPSRLPQFKCITCDPPGANGGHPPPKCGKVEAAPVAYNYDKGINTCHGQDIRQSTEIWGMQKAHGGGHHHQHNQAQNGCCRRN